MNEQELNAFLNRKIAASLNRQDGEVADVRATNLERYRGDFYGNEVEGQSKITTMEVFECVEWTMPSVMRVFSSSKCVEFEPAGQEDRRAAEQETDVVRHLLFNKENGFLSLEAWCKDTLLSPNGYAKVWIDTVEENYRERYEALGEQELTQLVSDENVEVLGAEQIPVTVMGPQGPMVIPAFNVEIRTTREKKKLRFEAVPGSEVLVDRDLTCIDLDDADFVAHRRKRTYTDLINDGFDRKKLDQVGESDEMAYGSEESRRFFYTDESLGQEEDDDDSMREFWVYECYCRVDTDGDGLAERRRVVKIGNTIFEDEETDYIPIVSMTSILMPHKHVGMEWVFAVKNLQEVSTALHRQLLTNIYRINVPRKFVGEDFLIPGETLDYLQDASAEIIPARNAMAIQTEQVVPIAQHILPVIQELNEQKNLRTGVNPNITLDPKVLQDATFGAFTEALSAAAQRVELLIRNMAETGVKKVVQKAHRLVREHFGESLAIELRGEWVNVSPKEWRDRFNLRVNVGTGNQNRAERITGLGQLLQVQKEAMAIGMVEPKHLFHTMDLMTETAGFGSAAAFFKDPNKEQIQPPQDPMAKVAEMQGQALLLDGQSKMTRAQVEQQKAQLEQQKAMFEANMRSREADLNERLKAFEAQQAMGVAQIDAQHTQADTALKLAQTDKVRAETHVTLNPPQEPSAEAA